MMVTSVRFCVLVIATCCVISLCGANNRDSVPEHASGDRQKRAVVKGLGIILKRAKQIYWSSTFQQFKKFGGYKKAKQDFDSLKPTNVMQYGNEKWGYVGRDTVILEKTEKGGASIKFVNGLAIPDGPIQRVHTNVIYFNKPRPKQIPRQTM